MWEMRACASVLLTACLAAGQAPDGAACVDRVVDNITVPGLGPGTLCDSLPYVTVHSSSNATEAQDLLLSTLLPALDKIPASVACRSSVILAMCSASVPACTAKGHAFQPCQTVCDRYTQDCAAELEKVDAATKQKMECSSWPVPPSFPNCPPFDSEAPCMAVSQVYSATALPGFIEQAAGSYCPLNGPRESTEVNDTQKNIMESVDTWEPVAFVSGVSKILVLVMWPASVFISIMLGALANAMQRQSQKASEAAKGSKTSIRFCTQVTLILLVWAASALMFFLAQWIADTNITSSFSNANQAQRETFLASDRNTELLTRQIFGAVGESFTRQVTAYFQAFAIAHNTTMQYMKVNDLDPRANVEKVLSQMLSTVEASPLMQEMTISLTITQILEEQSLVDLANTMPSRSTLPCASAYSEEGMRRCSVVCNGKDNLCLLEGKLNARMTVAVPRGVTDSILAGVLALTMANHGRAGEEYRAWGFDITYDSNSSSDPFPMKRRPVVYDNQSVMVPQAECAQPLASIPDINCNDPTTSLFNVNPVQGQPFLSGLWVFFGRLMMDLHTNYWVPSNTSSRWSPLFPAAQISRGLKLDDISNILQRLLQFDDQRLLLIENSTAGYFIALSHGEASENGLPRPASRAGDHVSRSILSSYTDQYNLSLCNETGAAAPCIGDRPYERSWPAIPHGVVQLRYDLRNTPYYCMAQSFSYLNFDGISFNMIPVFEIEEEVLLTTHQLHADLDKNFTQVNDSYQEGNKFMVIVSIGIIFGAALVSYLIAVTIAKPLTDMLRDMRDVANFRVEHVVRRYTTGAKREGRRSAFTEINAMQAYFVTMVKQLVELKKFMPDTALDDDGTSSFVSGRSGSSLRSGDGSSFAGSDSGSDNAVAERVVTVEVCYVGIRGVSEKALAASPLAAASPSTGAFGRTVSKRALNLRDQEVVKKAGKFVYHYTDGKLSMYDWLREVRACVDLPIAEPLEVTARVSQGQHMHEDEDGDEGHMDEEEEEVPIVDSRQLAHTLELVGERMNVIVRKKRKLNVIPVAASVWSVVAKTTKVLFMIHMFEDESSVIRRIGIIFAIVIIGGMFLNLVIAFRFNRQAMQLHPPMEEWLQHYVKEVTVGLVVGSFDVQNLEVMYCGLRVGKLLRFLAPMPSALKHNVVRLSMISLVTGQFVPLLMHFWYMDEANRWDDTFALVSLAFTFVAIFVSGVKKCVVFCLVDSSGVAKAGQEFKVKEKRQTLKLRTVSVVRAGIAGFGKLTSSGLTSTEIADICNAFYEQAMHIIKANKGSVTVFEFGRVEAVFNAPNHCPMHETFACRAAGSLVSMKMPQSVSWDPSRLGPFRVVAAVVYGPMFTGNLGSAKRKAFHYVGTQIELLPSFMHMAERIGATALLTAACADRLKERELEGAQDWGVVRPVDIIWQPEDGMPVTVHELVSTLSIGDDTAKAHLAAQLADYSSAFDFLEQGAFSDAREGLIEYLSNASRDGRTDVVAQHLLGRLNAATSGRRAPTIESFARTLGHSMDVGGDLSGRQRTDVSHELGSPDSDGQNKVTFNIGNGSSRRQHSLSSPKEELSAEDAMWVLPDTLDSVVMKPEVVEMIAQKQAMAARRESRALLNVERGFGLDSRPSRSFHIESPEQPVSLLSPGSAAPLQKEWSFSGHHQNVLRPSSSFRTQSGRRSPPMPPSRRASRLYKDDRRASLAPTSLTGVSSHALVATSGQPSEPRARPRLRRGTNYSPLTSRSHTHTGLDASGLSQRLPQTPQQPRSLRAAPSARRLRDAVLPQAGRGAPEPPPARSLGLSGRSELADFPRAVSSVTPSPPRRRLPKARTATLGITDTMSGFDSESGAV